MTGRCIAALLVLLMTAVQVSAQTQTAPTFKKAPTAPNLQVTPQTRKTPQLQISPKAVLQGPPTIGKRLVTQRLHYALEGVPASGIQYTENNDKIWTEPDESVIVIKGDIELGDREFWIAQPQIASFDPLFPGLPAGCRTLGGSYPQSFGHKRGFMIMIRFPGIQDNPACGKYFRDVKTITLNITTFIVQWEKYGEKHFLPVANPAPLTITLPPSQAKNPQPPD